ncbi:MAG: hypothetical protein PHW29_04435 [Flavobacterium sp.]|nr:hypothetical protein [Flavobacterium sp.]
MARILDFILKWTLLGIAIVMVIIPLSIVGANNLQDKSYEHQYQETFKQASLKVYGEKYIIKNEKDNKQKQAEFEKEFDRLWSERGNGTIYNR